MRKALLALLLVLGLRAQAQVPTWADDVACIVYSHCATCHHEGGIGGDHLTLMSYAEAEARKNDIRDATAIHYMPPWPPDQDYRRMAHERVLSQDEIDIIAAWANGGAPEGIPGNAPPPPAFDSNWNIPSPDITARMPDYTVPSLTEDMYRAFVLHIDNPTDVHIKRFEVIPGNTGAVHHVLIFQDTTGQAQQLDDDDPAPGYVSFGGIGVDNAKLVGLWVPGSTDWTAPPNMGIRLYANADIVIQVHYPSSAEGELDSTRVNFELDPSPFIRPIDINPVLEHFWTMTDGPLVIPANQVRTFHNQYTTPIPATITSIGPHAHLLCQQMKAFAVLPNNDTINLIDIPNWDFHWQGLYDFRKPIFLPTGTVLHGEATYDNTTNNEENPNDPPQLVTLGEATTDEMMLFYFAYTYGFATDTNIVIDDSDHPDHYLNCTTDFNIGVPEVTMNSVVRIAPVPADDRITVSFDRPGTIELVDAQGRSVLTERIAQGDNVIDVSKIAAGGYAVLVRDGRGVLLHRSPLVLR